MCARPSEELGGAALKDEVLQLANGKTEKGVGKSEGEKIVAWVANF
jgi:hypothetical protein